MIFFTYFKASLIDTIKIIALLLFIMPKANAHLMVAQHGTLNFLHDDVFMILSIPMSAFEGIDNNQDGDISMIEFNKNRSKINYFVKQKISLTENDHRLMLNGLMLSPVTSHHGPNKPITQLTVMGRFKLSPEHTKAQKLSSKPLTFHVNLFGRQSKEKTLDITVINKAHDLKQNFKLQPELNTIALFTEY